MTDKLPPNLLALFAPRPALRYLPPSDHAPEARKTMDIEGVGKYIQALKEYDDNYVPTESWLQRKDRLKQEKKEKLEKTLTEGVTTCQLHHQLLYSLQKLTTWPTVKPAEDPNVRGDPFRTLFVARLSYDTEVKDLEREFGRFGPIERVWPIISLTTVHLADKPRRFASSMTQPSPRMLRLRRRTEAMRLSCTSARRT